MKGGTKLFKVMASTINPGSTAAQDRHMFDTLKSSQGDNPILSPAGTDPAHAPTMDEWIETGDPTTTQPHSGGEGQSGGKRRRRRRRRTGGKKHSRKTKSKGKKTRSKSKKRRGGKRRTQRR